MFYLYFLKLSSFAYMGVVSIRSRDRLRVKMMSLNDFPGESRQEQSIMMIQLTKNYKFNFSLIFPRSKMGVAHIWSGERLRLKITLPNYFLRENRQKQSIIMAYMGKIYDILILAEFSHAQKWAWSFKHVPPPKKFGSRLFLIQNTLNDQN